MSTKDHLAGQVALDYPSNPKLPSVYVSDSAIMIHPSKQPDAKASLKGFAACR
ncbi:MAG TPA: hypothetical protein VGK73_09630 [Polyangiaceae bacterium]